MRHSEVPLIPVFARWFGSWQVRVERRPLTPEALVAAYDRARAGLAEIRRVLRPGGWVVTCTTRQSWLGAHIQEKWRTQQLTPERTAGWLSAAGLDNAKLDEPPRGLFRMTSLTTIGNNASAGTAGKDFKA